MPPKRQAGAGSPPVDPSKGSASADSPKPEGQGPPGDDALRADSGPSPDHGLTWAGPEELRPLLLPLTECGQDPDNIRTHSERNYESIRKSLRAFGQQKPVVRRKSDGVILAGNGWCKVALEEGWTHVAVVHTNLDSETAQRAYAAADNRTAELAGWDWEGARDLAELLANADEELRDMAFDDGWLAAIEIMVDGGSFDPLPTVTDPGERHGEVKVFMVLGNHDARDEATEAVRKLADTHPEWEATVNCT
jgi:hypothetical protein